MGGAEFPSQMMPEAHVSGQVERALELTWCLSSRDTLVGPWAGMSSIGLPQGLDTDGVCKFTMLYG